MQAKQIEQEAYAGSNGATEDWAVGLGLPRTLCHASRGGSGPLGEAALERRRCWTGRVMDVVFRCFHFGFCYNNARGVAGRMAGDA